MQADHPKTPLARATVIVQPRRSPCSAPIWPNASLARRNHCQIAGPVSASQRLLFPLPREEFHPRRQRKPNDLTSELQTAGYSLHLSHHPLDTKQEANTIRQLTRQPVDGFILLAAAKYLLPGLSEYLRKSGRPVVEITASKAEFDHVVHAPIPAAHAR